LTPQDLKALSPLHLAPRTAAPAVVAVGGDEPELWIDQSRRYHRKLVEAGLESEFMVTPGHHHFSITRAMAEPETPLFRAMLRLLAP
jgi:arylformamidase